MRHWYLEPSDDFSSEHYAVGISGNKVLIQLEGFCGERVRLSLNPQHTKHLIRLLSENLKKVDTKIDYEV